MRSRCVAFAFAVLLALGLGAPGFGARAWAQTPSGDPGQFIAALGNRVIHLIADRQQPTAQRKAAFTALVHQSFDVDGISRFILGPYWRTSSPAQRQQFEQAFAQYMIDVYWSRFGEYSGQTLSVTGVQPQGAGSSVVSSNISQPSGQPIAVDWRVSNRNGRLQITDVSVAGISEIITYRQEFAETIANNGGNIDGLTNQLRTKDQQIGG